MQDFVLKSSVQKQLLSYCFRVCGAAVLVYRNKGPFLVKEGVKVYFRVASYVLALVVMHMACVDIRYAFVFKEGYKAGGFLFVLQAVVAGSVICASVNWIVREYDFWKAVAFHCAL